ncbi:hypothetical protein D3C72_1854750 [compost metagenome]
MAFDRSEKTSVGSTSNDVLPSETQWPLCDFGFFPHVVTPEKSTRDGAQEMSTLARDFPRQQRSSSRAFQQA